jgi:hypothetical protein
VAEIPWTRGQVIIGQQLDQLKAEAWELLYKHGVEWTEDFDKLTTSMADLDDPLQKALGLFAQIGFCHCCESWQPIGDDLPPSKGRNLEREA